MTVTQEHPEIQRLIDDLVSCADPTDGGQDDARRLAHELVRRARILHWAAIDVDFGVMLHELETAATRSLQLAEHIGTEAAELAREGFECSLVQRAWRHARTGLAFREAAELLTLAAMSAATEADDAAEDLSSTDAACVITQE